MSHVEGYVRRVGTEHGSRIQPPMDPKWSRHAKLVWHAAVASMDCGLNIAVERADYRTQTLGVWRHVRGDWFDIHIGRGHVTGPMDFDRAWAYINGVSSGARRRAALDGPEAVVNAFPAPTGDMSPATPKVAPPSLVGTAAMPGCRIVGAEKPQVWRDEDGWNCDQTARCLKCGDVMSNRLAEDVPWSEALAASSSALPTTTPPPNPSTTEGD